MQANTVLLSRGVSNFGFASNRHLLLAHQSFSPANPTSAIQWLNLYFLAHLLCNLLWMWGWFL